MAILLLVPALTSEVSSSYLAYQSGLWACLLDGTGIEMMH